MKPIITLAVALAAISTPTWAEQLSPRFHSQAALPSTTDTSVVIIDERELLRRYLEEIEKRSDAEVRIELARLKLAQEMFRERFSWEKSRWNDERDEQKRDQWIRDFGAAYRTGAARAQEILSRAPGVSGCHQLELALQTGSSEFPAGSLEAQAHTQGMAAAFPECLNPDWIGVMRGIDTELTGMERELIGLQASLLEQSATESARFKLARDLRERVLSKLDDVLAGNLTNVQQSVQFEPELWNRITSTVNALSARMGSSVTLQVLLAEEALSVDSIYRIAYLRQNAGKYQPRIQSWQLAREVTTYLRERNPKDTLVLVLLNRIQTDLLQLEKRQQESWARATSEIPTAVRESMMQFSAELRDGSLSSLDPSVRKALTEKFLKIKFALEAYSRWEITTPLALPVVERLKSSYSRLLSLAASISNRTELPGLELRRVLHDRDGGVVVLQAEALLGGIPALESYLLGRTAAERAFWSSALSIQN